MESMNGSSRACEGGGEDTTGSRIGPKALILVYNFIVVFGAVCWMGFAAAGKLAIVSQSAYSLLGIGLAVTFLVIGGVLVYCNRYRSGAVMMFLGGLGTFPLGLLAIVAALRSHRLSSLNEAKLSLTGLCEHCGYDLRGTRIPRCPECGCLRGFDTSANELGVTEDELRSTKGERKRGQVDY